MLSTAVMKANGASSVFLRPLPTDLIMNSCQFCNVAARRLLNSILKPFLISRSCVHLTGFGDGKYISFEDRQWHQPCFKCSRCSVSLVGSGFFPDRGHILCTDCNSDDWPAPLTSNAADGSGKTLNPRSLAHEHCITPSQPKAETKLSIYKSKFSTFKCLVTLCVRLFFPLFYVSHIKKYK